MYVHQMVLVWYKGVKNQDCLLSLDVRMELPGASSTGGCRAGVAGGDVVAGENSQAYSGNIEVHNSKGKGDLAKQYDARTY